MFRKFLFGATATVCSVVMASNAQAALPGGPGLGARGPGVPAGLHHHGGHSRWPGYSYYPYTYGYPYSGWDSAYFLYWRDPAGDRVKLTQALLNQEKAREQYWSNQAKASEVAVRAADRCVQTLGGYGYLKDYAAERYYRDARQLMLVEGTSEIHRLIISRALDDGLLDWGYDVEAAGGVPGGSEN